MLGMKDRTSCACEKHSLRTMAPLLDNVRTRAPLLDNAQHTASTVGLKQGLGYLRTGIPMGLALLGFVSFRGWGKTIKQPNAGVAQNTPAREYVLDSITSTTLEGILRHPRAHHSSILIGNGIYTFGGLGNKDYLTSCIGGLETFDTKTQLTEAVSTPQGKSDEPKLFSVCGTATRTGDASFFIMGGNGVIPGGFVVNTSDKAVTPAGGGPPKSNRLTCSTAHPISSGRTGNGENIGVIVIGGYVVANDADGSLVLVPTNKTYTYNAMDNTLVDGPSMMHSRARHVSCTLADGNILVCGGMPGPGNSAEIYRADAGRFEETGRPWKNRFDASAALLPDGNVLIFGGKDPATGKSINTAEMYLAKEGRFVTLSGIDSAAYADFAENGFAYPGDGCQTSHSRGRDFMKSFNLEPGSANYGGMNELREDFCSFTGPDGSVFAVGGKQDYGQGTPDKIHGSIERWTRKDNTWEIVVKTTPRHSFSLVQLPDSTAGAQVIQRYVALGGVTETADDRGAKVQRTTASVERINVFYTRGKDGLE